MIRVLFATAPADAAPGIVRTLIDERLIACGNILPGVRSIYRWKGEVCDDAEVALFMETAAERLEDALDRVRELHPYDVPKILVLDPTRSTDEYAAWVLEQTTSPPRGDEAV